MPNAKDLEVGEFREKFIVLGPTGSGKTTQFLTLPGRKFMYLFDPNAVLSLRGHDVDFEQFMPDILNLDISSLSGKKGEGGKKRRSIMNTNSADVYSRWEQDVDTRLEDGFFDAYDWVGFDSFTTLSSMVMDSVLALNGRPGMWPQQDDYAPQMNALTKIVRTFTGRGLGVYFTGHDELLQDKLTQRIITQPLMTGRLRATLPLLFSEVLHFQTEAENKEVFYDCLTKPTRQVPLVRCSRRDFKPVEDITLDWSKPLDQQGLGCLYYGKKGAAATKS